MARVDPGDDSIRRLVIYHYAFDPIRRERRHQVVAAFDDVGEFEAELDRARDTTSGIDHREHWIGMVKEAGYDRQARANHLARRCIEHGVRPPEVAPDAGGSVTFIDARDDDSG